MKKWIIPVLSAFILMSCSLPFTIQWNTPTVEYVTATPAAATENVVVITATPEQATQPAATPAPQFTGTEKNLGGVFMVIPECMASDATGVIVPENNPGNDAPYFAINPEYRKISFIGYPLTGKIWDPQLLVFPIARYLELVPDLSTRVSSLQQDLASQPAEYTQTIPLLPEENAAEVFHAQVSYINFQNGKGVAFLAEYAQYFAPANNTDLFYAFQGLTNDGKYWVSLLLPVNAAYLQASSTDTAVPADGIAAPSMMDTNAEQEFKDYYAAVVQKLNSTPSDSFTPSLSCISQLVQSLSISD